ncbi:MAG: glycine cleavage system aminomethyltransferase GcvT [Bdellovibrionia bacterium]
MLKRTALYEEHVRMGGRLIDFGGWELPVQYSGVMEEHETCRKAAGLFDVSHMGEVHVEGSDAERYLNYLVTNNVAKIAIGQAQYTSMCHESGGIVDDLVIYRRAKDKFLVVVNASNTDKDFKHMLYVQSHLEKKHPGEFNDLRVTNESSRYTQIALQGRHAAAILGQLTSSDLSSIKTYWFLEGEVLGIPAIIGRTGYTGEDGFEIYVPWERGPEVWRALEEKGKPYGLKPCGLGARDTLRLEMKYPLYGNELTDETLPLEVGLGWVFKADKGDFMGRTPNVEAKAKGLNRGLAGIKLLGRGIPRHGYKIFTQDGTLEIGEVTSGTQSPSLKQSIGIAYVKSDYSKLGTQLTVDIRGTKVPAEIISTPFYKRPY